MEKSTKFIFMGDPQCDKLGNSDTSYYEWCRLLKLGYNSLYGEYPTKEQEGLLVLAGDIANKGGGCEEWEAFFDTGGEMLRSMRVISPVGNSENQYNDEYMARFNMPSNGPKFHEKDFFSYDYGCVHFIVLDTDYMGNRNPQAFKYIREWIRTDNKRHSQPITIVVMHHPMYTVGDSYDDYVRADAMRTNYLELFRKIGVDIILCGHQHLYCRTDDNKHEIPQLMGVSGSKFFDADRLSNMAVGVENKSVVTCFTVTPSSIKLETYDSDGETVDKYEKSVGKKQARICSECDKYKLCKNRRLKRMNPANDPLEKPFKDGIIISKGGDAACIVTEREMEGGRKVNFSIRKRSGIISKDIKGIPLVDLLNKVGWSGEENTVIFSAEDGHSKAFLIEDIINRWTFLDYDSDGHYRRSAATALIYNEPDVNGRTQYKLACGQRSPEDFNRRNWIDNITEIELVRIETEC